MLADAGAVQLITSDPILAEVERVLAGGKFAWPQEEISKAVRQISRLTERVTPAQTLDIVKADPTDNRILECADAGKADYIVSGDKHLLQLKQHGTIPVMKVADFIRRLQGQASQQR